MPLDLDENKSLYQIRSYRPGQVQINEKTYTQSLIITPNDIIESFPAQTIHALTADFLQQIPALKPDIVLIGTGPQHIFINPEIYAALINHQIGVEVMNTGAACRTFNALSSENRQVLAILILN